METFLPGQTESRGETAQAARGLHIRAGDVSVAILRKWKAGFSVSLGDAGRLRGLVDLMDGPRHLSRCLIVAVGEEAGEMRYEIKRTQPVLDSAPLDFERPGQGGDRATGQGID